MHKFFISIAKGRSTRTLDFDGDVRADNRGSIMMAGTFRHCALVEGGRVPQQRLKFTFACHTSFPRVPRFVFQRTDPLAIDRCDEVVGAPIGGSSTDMQVMALLTS